MSGYGLPVPSPAFIFRVFRCTSVRPCEVFPQITERLCSSFFFFNSFVSVYFFWDSFYCYDFVSSSSLIFSSAMSNLLFIEPSIFFISHGAISISIHLIWVIFISSVSLLDFLTYRIVILTTSVSLLNMASVLVLGQLSLIDYSPHLGSYIPPSLHVW